ncbi:unnamed protein product [Owenia fusiformis]|nr:unnamed protein product [Owenia fusiformis]
MTLLLFYSLCILVQASIVISELPPPPGANLYDDYNGHHNTGLFKFLMSTSLRSSHCAIGFTYNDGMNIRDRDRIINPNEACCIVKFTDIGQSEIDDIICQKVCKLERFGEEYTEDNTFWCNLPLEAVSKIWSFKTLMEDNKLHFQCSDEKTLCRDRKYFFENYCTLRINLPDFMCSQANVIEK